MWKGGEEGLIGHTHRRPRANHGQVQIAWDTLDAIDVAATCEALEKLLGRLLGHDAHLLRAYVALGVTEGMVWCVHSTGQLSMP